jgi:hypothetical protein
MKLSTNERELLIFASKTALGAITTQDGSYGQQAAQKLVKKGLMKYYAPVGLSYGANYYSLTQEGWDQADQIANSK